MVNIYSISSGFQHKLLVQENLLFLWYNMMVKSSRSLKISLALEIADDHDSLCAYSPVNTIAE